MAKENGGIIGVVNTPTTSVATGVWALEDQFNARVSNIWPGQPYSIDFLVVAGGGGGATFAGGGAGGMRASATTYTNAGPSSPRTCGVAGLPVTATAYPITVGAGGAGVNPPSIGLRGSNSVFSTITSTGGGGGSNGSPPGGNPAEINGGSGGGGGGTAGTLGTGNTPPVNPPQGSNGGDGLNVPGLCNVGGGGGGAMAAGTSGTSPYYGGNGGAGAGITGFGTSGELSGGFYYFSGGGGAETQPSRPASFSLGGLGGGAKGRNNAFSPPTDFGQAGTANTGGGGGGGTNPGSPSPGQGAGGKGIVVIRYKFQ